MTGSPALELRGFGWRPVGRSEPVLADLDLRVVSGERVLLVGPSGAGKSTILRAAAGVLGDATEGDRHGQVLVDGADPAGVSRSAPAAGRTGLVLQRPGDAVVASRVGRDVAFGPENAGLPRGEVWNRVHEALELVELEHGVDVPTASLSGGETQRLALAGALAMRPRLLLLDEPTAMLDPAAAASVRAAVSRVVTATAATLVVVEHQWGDWLPYVDRVVALDADGRLLADGPPTGCSASTPVLSRQPASGCPGSPTPTWSTSAGCCRPPPPTPVCVRRSCR